MLFGNQYFSAFDVNSTLSLTHPSLTNPVRQHLLYEIIRSMLATLAKLSEKGYRWGRHVLPGMMYQFQ